MLHMLENLGSKLPFDALRFEKPSQQPKLFVSSPFMFLSCVIDALTLPVVEDNATSAQNKLTIEKIRSRRLTA